MDMKTLLVVAGTVLTFNLPFGYWRSNVKRFSKQWFLAVHIPVPFVIALRILSGMGWRLITFPVMVGAFFTGQLLGGVIQYLYNKNKNSLKQKSNSV